MSSICSPDSSKPIKLNNTTCIYCGKPFTSSGQGKRTKEHVVGRRFVPRGVLDGCWNLIAWACLKHNREKGALEDQISAISMQPNIFGGYATDDLYLPEEARRKAKGSKSRRTGRLVQASSEEINVGGELMKAPPQVDKEQVWQLARYHINAFFYWITYDSESQRGRFAGSCFGPVGFVHRGDWGNEQIVAFGDLIKSWLFRVHAEGSEGYFKILIRRADEENLLWAWALEWNHNLRVFGFAGEKEQVRKAFAHLPQLTWNHRQAPGGSPISFRIETPIAPANDNLFGEEATPT